MKIGLITPLTGPLASYGQGSVDGLKVWTQTVGAQQGIDGRPVKVYTVDEGTTPASGAAAARQLVSDGVNLVIGPTSSNVAPAALPVFTRAGIVDMSNLTFAPAAQPSVFPYTYVLTLNQADDAISQQKYACKIGVTKIAFVAPNNVQGAAVLNADKAALPNAPCHLDVVATEQFESGSTDLSAQINAAKSAGAQLIMDGAAFTADQVAIFRAVQDANWTPWIFGNPTAGTKQAITNVSSSLLAKIGLHVHPELHPARTRCRCPVRRGLL